ncbi:MAG: hypothetical protein ACQ9MH_19190 [Nitrospinales bacterium]
MGFEQDRITRIMENMARGEDYGNKLVYDRNTKTIKPMSSAGNDPDSSIKITPADANLF